MAHSITKRVAILAMSAVVLAGCTAAPDATPEVDLGVGNLNVRLTSDWNTLDPSGEVNPTTQAWSLIYGLYDRLLSYNQAGEVIPYLATEWEQPDASTVRFELRPDVTCTDGTPLTPTMVANSFERAFQSPSVKAFFGLAADPTITPDDAANSIEFKWSAPNADAFFAFTGAGASVICPAGLEDPTTLTTTPAGTGAYTLEDVQQGASVVLRQNPAWAWGVEGLTAADLPDTLTFQVVTTDTTAANQLTTGEFDVASIVGTDIERLQATDSLTLITSSVYKTSPLMMNQTPGRAAADADVRLAIMTAVDPEEWNIAAYNGRGVTSSSVFVEGSLCYEPDTADYMPEHGVDEAREILEDAGYALGADGKFSLDGQPLILNVIGSPAQFAKGTEYIADRLNSAGFTVKLDDIERNDWITRMRAGDYDVTVFPGAGANVPSANMQYIAGNPPPDGTNYSYAYDETVNDAYSAARRADAEDRCDAWSDLQIDLLKNYVILPLAAPTFATFTQANVTATTWGTSLDTPTIRRIG